MGENETYNSVYVDTGNMIIKYFFPFSLIIGTCGNFMIVIITRRKSIKACISVSLILTTLAISDTTVLWVSEFKNWLFVVFNYDFARSSAFSCKLTRYLFYCSSHLSNWLVVLFTIERFICVWFPLRVKNLCSSKKMAIAVILLIFGICSVNIVWLLFYHIGIRGNCTTKFVGRKFYSYFPIINIIMAVVLPFLIVLVLNTFIITGLIRSRKSFNMEGYRNRYSKKDSNQKRRITIGLMLTSMLWLILTMPQALVENIKPKLSYGPYFLLQTIVFMALYVNYSINFYIYMLSSKNIYWEFMGLFGRRKPSSIKLRTVK